MKGLILANGSINDFNFLENMIKDHDFLLCVDGGFDYILNLGLKADLLIGDLDSISKKSLSYIKKNNIKVLKFPEKKNKTDTELALDWMLEKDFSHISLVGVLGSRIDHSLANIHLLRKIYQKGLSGKIYDENNIIRYSRGKTILRKNPGYNISIIPLSLEGVIVSLEGFLYNLEKEVIDFASTLTISNIIIGEYGTIIIDKGEALIFESRD